MLIARFVLALFSFTFLLWLAWTTREFRVASWLLGLAGLAAVPIFQWSCESIQRWAPNYSEPAFREVLESLRDGDVVQADAVLSSLGPPFVKGITSNGDEAWSYSYMPSGGFGWDKRILVVQQGVVVSGYSLDEP